MALPVDGIRIDGPAEGRQGRGLERLVHHGQGSVPVRARDHRKRRCDQIAPILHQRDYALALLSDG